MSATPSSNGPRDGIESAVFEVFQEVLARVPTPPERVEWSAKLLRGVPVRHLRATLLESPEHAERRHEPKVSPPDISPEVAGTAATGLFDGAWYRRRYPDIAESGIDPLRHYADHGWREDRAPNPYFDPTWYRSTHRLQAHEPPLFHYASVGEPSDLRPSVRFDPAWYRATYISATAVSPLADFLRRRHTDTVAPSAAAWAALGLRRREPGEQGPGERKDGPHGYGPGDGTGIGTDPADDVFLALGDEPADVALLRDTPLFDENYYALHSGDVLAAGTDLLAHYCEFGWREQRAPNFYFDARWYTATNPEVARLGVNPLAHYLLKGEPAGRRPVVYFDPVWYRDTYGVPAGASALGHFLSHRREGVVSPNPLFDPAWYAAQKGEPVRPGRDPFARFLVAGLMEDYSPSAAFDLAAWRKATRGRVSRHFRHLLDPSKDNPLVDYLLRHYL